MKRWSHLFEELVEFALFEENNSVEILSLDIPELFLKRTELSIDSLRNKQCSRIIIGVSCTEREKRMNK
jgi:DNA polymerase III delta subunit